LVQKVSGADKPVPLWPEESVHIPKAIRKPLLYHFRFRLKVIITQWHIDVLRLYIVNNIVKRLRAASS